VWLRGWRALLRRMDDALPDALLWDIAAWSSDAFSWDPLSLVRSLSPAAHAVASAAVHVR
jgi:hypothetical protein